MNPFYFFYYKFYSSVIKIKKFIEFVLDPLLSHDILHWHQSFEPLLKHCQKLASKQRVGNKNQIEINRITSVKQIDIEHIVQVREVVGKENINREWQMKDQVDHIENNWAYGEFNVSFKEFILSCFVVS